MPFLLRWVAHTKISQPQDKGSAGHFTLTIWELAFIRKHPRDLFSTNFPLSAAAYSGQAMQQRQATEVLKAGPETFPSNGNPIVSSAE